MLQPSFFAAFLASLLLMSCKDSNDSKSSPGEESVTPPPPDAPPLVQADAVTDAAAASDVPVENPEEPADTEELGQAESPLQLAGASLAFQRLHFDCGNVREPLADASVKLLSDAPLEIRSLAATIPAKDKALLHMTIQDGAQACDYRAQFSVNKGFSAISFESSQALNAEGLTACFKTRAALDSALGGGPLPIEYDRPYILWVAIHIPQAMALTPVCSSGPLRVAFATQL